MGEFHYHLGEILSEITRFFSFILLGMIVDNSIHVSVAIYHIHRFLKSEEEIQLFEYLDFGSILFWLLVKVLILYFLCVIPVTVTDEVQKISKKKFFKSCVTKLSFLS